MRTHTAFGSILSSSDKLDARILLIPSSLSAILIVVVSDVLIFNIELHSSLECSECVSHGFVVPVHSRHFYCGHIRSGTVTVF